MAADYALRAEKARDEFRALHVSEAVSWPGLRLLPAPAQKLCVVALAEAHDLLTQGVETRALADELRCDCLQWRRYTLSCKHIWQQELVFGQVITPRAFAEFEVIFADNGFDVYEHTEAEYSQPADDPLLEAAAGRRF